MNMMNTAFPPARDWDILVIGGGITGAGILLEAARRGLKALLVEQNDFAWGTSSRSSKLVHVGLRYLAAGSLRLAHAAVREREALLRAAPGLVEPQGFAFADGAAGMTPRPGFLAVMRLVEMLAGRREPRWEKPESRRVAGPHADPARSPGGIRYTDAKTDDARLVLRVLDEARRHGAVALNYVTVQSLVRDGGKVHGAMLADARTRAEYAVRARVVVNATGAWSDLAAGQGAGLRLRALRTSHLVLPSWRLPLTQAVSLLHPEDGRQVFVFPWEGVTLVGTTSSGPGDASTSSAHITRQEVDYLMAALDAQFPQLELGDADVLATFAGVRPVLDHGPANAPAADDETVREHAVWSEPGLVSVAGGRLTTFRSIALDVLRQVALQIPAWQFGAERGPVFARVAVPPRADVAPGVLRRLAGRHGQQAPLLLKAAHAGELECIPGTETLWAELRWAARAEQVHHLDDLLLRRTRIGILLAGGGIAQMERIRAICQSELVWTDEHWEKEEQRYLAGWRTQHGMPAAA